MEALKDYYQSLEIPRSPGVYILHLELSSPRMVRIGKFGDHHLPPGEYLYVGSALGSGGLKARLGHHLRGSKRHHWHIDWLRRVARVRGFFYTAMKEHCECSWSQFLMQLPGSCIPVPGFGASDCSHKPTRCPAHLLRFEMGVNVKSIQDNLPVNGESQVEYQKLTYHFQPDFSDIE